MLYPQLIGLLIEKDTKAIYDFLEENKVPSSNLANKCLYHIAMLGSVEHVLFLIDLISKETIKEIDLIESVFIASHQYSEEVKKVFFEHYPEIILAKELNELIFAKDEENILKTISDEKIMNTMSNSLYIHCIKMAVQKCSEPIVEKMVEAYKIFNKVSLSLYTIHDIYKDTIIYEEYATFSLLNKLEKLEIKHYNDLLKEILIIYITDEKIAPSINNYNKLVSQIIFISKEFKSQYQDKKSFQSLLVDFFEPGNHKEINLCKFYLIKTTSNITELLLTSLYNCSNEALNKIILKAFDNSSWYNDQISSEMLSYLFVERGITIKEKMEGYLKTNVNFQHLKEKITIFNQLNNSLISKDDTKKVLKI